MFALMSMNAIGAIADVFIIASVVYLIASYRKEKDDE